MRARLGSDVAELRYTTPDVVVAAAAPLYSAPAGMFASDLALAALAVAVGAAVLLGAFLLLRPLGIAPAKRLRRYGPGAPPRPTTPELTAVRPDTPVGRWTPRRLRARFTADVERGDIGHRPGRIMLVAVAGSVVSAVAVAVLTGRPATAIVVAPLGPIVAWVYVTRRASSWYAHFDSTLADSPAPGGERAAGRDVRDHPASAAPVRVGLDGAGDAVDEERGAGRDRHRAGDAHHARDAELAGDDRGVAGRAAALGHQGQHQRAGRGRRCRRARGPRRPARTAPSGTPTPGSGSPTSWAVIRRSMSRRSVTRSAIRPPMPVKTVTNCSTPGVHGGRAGRPPPAGACGPRRAAPCRGPARRSRSAPGRRRRTTLAALRTKPSATAWAASSYAASAASASAYAVPSKRAIAVGRDLGAHERGGAEGDAGHDRRARGGRVLSW